MLNIEHLKKQAKLYLRWHREGYYPVAARIRAVLPRFRHLNDREVLGVEFRLSDAQELVARSFGFDSWPALRRGSRFVDQLPTLPMSILTGAEPQLYVRDISLSCDFYSHRLGFAVAFSYGEPPFYAQVFRDGARLNLRHVDKPVIDADRRDTEQLLAAAITLEDAKPLFLEYRETGVEFAQLLRSEPWGARTFIVRDPDGNLLLFAGRAERADE
jgi:catechol 2,3-dioxygenase-like lactoylglutathione lyase family enzyme